MITIINTRLGKIIEREPSRTKMDDKMPVLSFNGAANFLEQKYLFLAGIT